MCLQGCVEAVEAEKVSDKQKEQDAVDNKHDALYDVISDQEMVDRVFGFLPSLIGGQEGQAPLGFEVKTAINKLEACTFPGKHYLNST